MYEKAPSSLAKQINSQNISKSPRKPSTSLSQMDRRRQSLFSPFKVIQSFKEIGALSSEMEHQMGRLLTIFLFYSTYGDKLNITSLKSSKFHKLLIDARIEDDENKKMFEILYSEICKTGTMGFQSFLNSLVKISSHLYPQYPVEDGLISLVTDNLGKLYDTIENEMKSSCLGKITEDEEIPHHAISLIMSVDTTLYGIYCFYFEFENSITISYEDRFARGLGAALKFIIDFEIYPALISRPLAFYIYQLIANKKSSQIDEYVKTNHVGNSSSVITFAKFIEYFIKIGVNCSILQESVSIFDKLLKYLERLQLSKGFKLLGNFPRIKGKLLPSRETMERIQLEEEKMDEKIDEENLAQMKDTINKSQSSASAQSQSISSIEKNKYRMQSIFEHYCSIGDSENITKLKSVKYIRLLRECGIVKPLNEKSNAKFPLQAISADLIFSQYSASQKATNKSIGIMDFNQFLNSLVTIAIRIFPDSDCEKSIKCLLNEYILSLEEKISGERIEKNKNLVQILDMANDKNMMMVLEIVKKSLSPFFKYYTAHKEYLCFASFMKFCSDFEIFPQTCSKQFIVKLFHMLANMQLAKPIKREKPNQSIDEELFVQGIAICAMEIVYLPADPPKDEKIIRLLQKMSKSKGVTIITKNIGTTKLNSGEYDIMKSIQGLLPDDSEQHRKKEPCSFLDVIKICSSKD